jgi:predicted dehydrogenase
VVLTFCDGSKATLTSGDTFVGESVTTFDMYGNDAVFKCRFSQADLLDVYFSDDKGIEDEHFVEKNDSNIGHHRAIVSEEIIRGYYGEIQDFLECMLEGREPLSGFQIAREAAELTQIAYLSAEQNRTIVL